MEKRKRKKTGWPYHGKANICFLQGWAIVGAIPCHSHHLPLVPHGAVDDSCDGNEELKIPKKRSQHGSGWKTPKDEPQGRGSAHLSPGCACPWGRNVPAPAAWARSCPAAPVPPAGPGKREVKPPCRHLLSHQRENPSWDRKMDLPQMLLSVPAASLSKGKRKSQHDLGNPGGFGKLKRIGETQQDSENPARFAKPIRIQKTHQNLGNPARLGKPNRARENPTGLQDLGNPAGLRNPSGLGNPKWIQKTQQDSGNPAGFGKPIRIQKTQQDFRKLNRI